MIENNGNKKPIYKQIWFIPLVICLSFIIGISIGNSTVSKKDKETIAQVEKSQKKDKADIESRASEAEALRLKRLEEAQQVSSSSSESASSKSSLSSSQYTQASKTQEATPKQSTTSVPNEYLTALNKASDYSKTMNMSKAGLYNQLTSEYGEKYSPEAAQYAIDNLQVDYNQNALKKAKDYQSTMNMSPEGIRDQLISEYGEKFTSEEAEYAIQHLND
ncbi:MAG: Ltp family lipoprotein [Pseudolactococcus laudensis]